MRIGAGQKRALLKAKKCLTRSVIHGVVPFILFWARFTTLYLISAFATQCLSGVDLTDG